MPFLFILLGLTHSFSAFAQYRTPPSSIAKLVDAPRFPSQSLSPEKKVLLLLTSRNAPPIQELISDEIRLAGLRINPNNHAQSRIRRAYKSLSIVSPKTGSLIEKISFKDGFIAFPKWSPKGDHLAFIHITPNALQLYTLMSPTYKLKKLATKTLNAVIGSDFYHWSAKSDEIFYLARSNIKKPNFTAKSILPIIQETGEKKTNVRTYQDLIKSPEDELKFSYLFTSELRKKSLSGRDISVTKPDMILDFLPSPTNKNILITRIKKPFSYLVPYYRFPMTIEVIGTSPKIIANLPASDSIPQGFSATYMGPRSVRWVPNTKDWLIWVEAQDQGDPKISSDVRDRVFLLKNLKEKAKAVLDLKFRFSSIIFYPNQTAIVQDRWWTSRKESTAYLNLQNSTSELIYRRNYEDIYSSPGEPLSISRGNAQSLGVLKGDKILFTGTGYSPKGNRPFLSELDLKTKKFTKLWQSPESSYRHVLRSLDNEGRFFLGKEEKSEENPNYFLLDLQNGAWKKITSFKHPYPEFKGITKKELRYTRADGVHLSATLYLPRGAKKGDKLPILLWAYPREFKSKKAASQLRTSKHQFNRVSYWGPLPYLAEGFAVLDKVAMPIIGEGDQEPNDSFVSQLKANAEAALETAKKSGYIDTNKAFIGGHSYGAFMAANLLAHSNLFRGGIGRSGAYNRTFTPFGFQAEERTYWQAPQVYNAMSPFQNADKIDEPLLLIHGEKDNNSGTFPIQSQRLYHAISGLGGTARLVILPQESHGYRARESIMHVLWEQLRWLKTYSK